MLDLYHATRDELIQLVHQQRAITTEQARQMTVLQAEVAELRAVLATLTTQLGLVDAPSEDDDSPRGTPARMPGLKPVQAPERPARQRKRRAKGAGRTRMTATTRVVHALTACPACGAPLAGGTLKRTREVIELPPPRVVVTEHAYLDRRCPDGGKRCVPTPDLGGAVTGQGRFGHGVTSLITVLREEARLPVRVIQTLLATLTGLHLSVGAVIGATARVAVRAQAVVTDLQQAIRASPVVHVDETGWREAGRNGYIWTFSTPQERLFVHGSRARAMVDQVLGETFAGVVVSDFYTAYTTDDRTHQYCWAHLLRDLHELVDQHPDTPTVQGWARAVHAVFVTAQTGATGSPAQRRHVRTQVEVALKQLCTPWRDTRTPQTTLCARILRHLESLFVFVTEPTVPATNNAAERSLRHLVISRKISGGTRSVSGTRTKMTLASLLGTWRLQRINPYLACRDLLASPQF
jgi:transposase